MTRLQLGRATRSGAVFALANASQRALVFVLLPVYTATMDPATYGRLGLMLSIQAFAMLALQGGLDVAIMRRYFAYEGAPADRDRFINSIWLFILLTTSGVVALSCALLVLCARSSDLLRPTELALVLLSAGTFTASTVVPLTVLRAAQRLRAYVLLSGVAAASTTGLTLLFVVGLQGDVIGWFAASTLSNLIILIVSLKVLPWRRIDHFDRVGVRAAVLLGCSLLPHAVSLWALALGDRIVLAGALNPADLGVYTLAANLAMPAMVVIQSMNYGFLPSYGRAQTSGQHESLAHTVTIQALFVAGASLTAVVLAPLVVSIIDPAYSRSTGIVPWLVLGVFFWGLYQLPMNMVSMVHGRTRFVWIVGLCAALVGVGSLAALVGSYGVRVAGPASTIGYFALLLFAYTYLRLLRQTLPIFPGRVMVGFCFGFSVYLLSLLVPDGGPVGWSLRPILALMGVLALSVIGGFRGPRSRRSSRAAVVH